MEDQRKKAAAVTAVMAYVQQEQHAAATATVAIPADLYRQLYGIYQQLRLLFQ